MKLELFRWFRPFQGLLKNAEPMWIPSGNDTVIEIDGRQLNDSDSKKNLKELRQHIRQYKEIKKDLDLLLKDFKSVL
jgi:hypothetical protein